MPSGDTLRYSVYVPPDLRDDGPKVPLILGLHFGGMAAPFIGGAYLHQLVKPALQSTGAVIVAPDALTEAEASFRAESWTSARNEAAVLWLRERLLEVYPIDPARVVITGYSRGGAGVWMMADKHRDKFSAALAVSSRPAYEVVEEIGIPAYVIHSFRDEVIGAVLVQGAVQQLQEKGATVRLQMLDGPTHYQTGSFIAALQATVPWLADVWRASQR
jgi:predicted peptidase